MVLYSRAGRARLPRRFARWFIGLNLTAALALGGWYVAQPAARRAEVERLVENTFAQQKRVTVLDLVWDVWQLYYADSARGKVASGDKTHIYGGPPQGTGGKAATRILVNQGYAVGYSDELGAPLWAAYRVWDLARLTEPPKRPDKFAVDRRTTARVTPELYSGSGYDRGHLAPNYAIATRHGAPAQRETFLMSNIVPQRATVNSGLWRELEMKIATSYPARYAEVWVVTGPIFPTAPKRLRGRVAVPEAFFKIIIDENEGRLRTLAFIVPQDAPANADASRYVSSIEEIQRRTGLDFLSELPDEDERAIESAKATRVW